MVKSDRLKALSFMTFDVKSERQDAVAPFLDRITAHVHEAGLVLVSAKPVA